MNKLRMMLKRFRDSKKAQGLVEYGLILALVSAVAIGSLSGVGGKLKGSFSKIDDTLIADGGIGDEEIVPDPDDGEESEIPNPEPEPEPDVPEQPVLGKSEAILAENLDFDPLSFNELPGPSELVVGDHDAGFFGEVPASEFITGSSVASIMGLTAGDPIDTSDVWLKFAAKGNVIYTAKNSMRENLSWNDINGAGLATGGRALRIDGPTYQVRLLQGFNYSNRVSEWRTLIQPLHELSKDNNFGVEDWTNHVNNGKGYTHEDLNIGSGKNGSNRIMMESTLYGENTIFRGVGDNDFLTENSHTMVNLNSDGGWMPVLRVMNEKDLN